MKISVFNDPSCFDVLAVEWSQLLEKSVSKTIFLTPQWQKTWWSALGEGELYVMTFHDDDNTLIGIAPLFYPEPERISVVGYKEVTDYVDVIFAKGHEEVCFAALLDHLALVAPQWVEFIMYNVPEFSVTHRVLPQSAGKIGWKTEVKIEDVCPQITLPTSFDDYLNMLDGKERRELQRKLRRASEETKIVYSTDSATLDQDVADFIRLMMASTFAKSDFMNPRMEQYFYAQARAMFNAGWLQLAFLEVEGERAAAYLNFVYDRQVLVYNSGLDPRKFAYLSPGQVLIARLIEQAIAEGNRVFDFLQGTEEYKYKLGGKDIKVFNVAIAR
jgi:CelD/BcsL family acetyltransferase involved in cellulose biosynthesis